MSQRETRARVRVLVWCPGDLPAPAYQSGWIPLYNSGQSNIYTFSYEFFLNTKFIVFSTVKCCRFMLYIKIKNGFNLMIRNDDEF